MYHGTREEKLTRFDTSTFQKNEPLRGGEGFYFTDKRGYALGYTYDKDYNTSEKRVGEYALATKTKDDSVFDMDGIF